MSFSDLRCPLQELAGIPKNPGTSAHIKSNNPGRSASPPPHMALLQSSSSKSPKQQCLHKVLKDHPCPGETLASLRLRTNDKNLKLAPEGKTNKSKPDKGYPVSKCPHWKKGLVISEPKSMLINTEVMNVPVADVILSHHCKKQPG